MRDDYYELLGIRNTATAKEVGRAFRKASLRLHPDKVCNQLAVSPDAIGAAEVAFAAVREAYDTLSDPVARDRYDQRATGMNWGYWGLDVIYISISKGLFKMIW